MPDDAWTDHAHAIVACAREETPHVVEWLEYHRSVGFDHVYLYCNDDDPRGLLRTVTPYLFGPRPFVTFRHWPIPGERAEMFLHFLGAFKERTGWFVFLDVDEFLVFKNSVDVGRFLQPFEADADGVAFNCVGYGANGKAVRDDASVLMSHLRRAAAAETRTKMICRAGSVDAARAEAAWRDAGVAFWQGLDGCGLDAARCVDVLRRPMQGRDRDLPAAPEPPLESPDVSEALINTGYVAHFRFKSEQDFRRRAGRPGFADAAHWAAVSEPDARRAILDRDNAVYDTYLAGYWHRWTASALDVALRIPAEAPPAPNIALNKPSWQSSIYEPQSAEPASSRVFGGGNDGFRTGTYGFHTKQDDSPWWVVDLLGAFGVAGVRVFNRADNPTVAGRSAAVDILVSMDAASWTVIHSRTDPEPFGGVSGGEPLSVMPPDPAPARFLALRLRDRQFLHLDEVEVYGLPL